MCQILDSSILVPPEYLYSTISSPSCFKNLGLKCLMGPQISDIKYNKANTVLLLVKLLSEDRVLSTI